VAPTITSGPGGNIDTAGAALPLTCNVTLNVTDALGNSDTDTTPVTVNDAGTNAAVNGPYAGPTNGGPTVITPTAGPSTCAVPTCTYTWTLRCPGEAPKTYTGLQPNITVGPGGDVNTTGITAPKVCPLDMTVTDGAGTTDTVTTNVTGYPLAQSPTADAGGPYNVTPTAAPTPLPGLTGADSNCTATPCT
jgi:hypothetical protein